MQRQTEITKPIQLLDGRGNLRRPGYSRTMVPGVPAGGT